MSGEIDVHPPMNEGNNFGGLSSPSVCVDYKPANPPFERADSVRFPKFRIGQPTLGKYVEPLSSTQVADCLVNSLLTYSLSTVDRKDFPCFPDEVRHGIAFREAHLSRAPSPAQCVKVEERLERHQIIKEERVVDDASMVGRRDDTDTILLPFDDILRELLLVVAADVEEHAHIP